MKRPIYLDYNATTPVDPRVRLAMMPYLDVEFGNASSTHEYGIRAQLALAHARESVALLLGAGSDEIVFTGGGSESDNLALKGAVLARHGTPMHIISDVAEHPAILATLTYLHQRFDVDVTLLPVDDYGRVDVDSVRRAIRPQTVLVSVMHANNEVGTLQPIAEIGAIARDAGILFHVDAAQSAGKVPINVDRIGADLLTIAGHKVYAPKGVGALYVRHGTMLDPLVHGSGQEHGMRAGTENVAGVVALGRACELAREEMDGEGESARLRALRDQLQHDLQMSVAGLEQNGHCVERLPNTLNVSFPNVIGSTVLALAPDVAASTGAACHSTDPSPSAVLMAMGLSRTRALGAVRLSLGRMTTKDDVSRASVALIEGYDLAVAL